MVCSPQDHHDRFGVAFVDDGRSQPEGAQIVPHGWLKNKVSRGDLTGLFENVFLVE